MPLPVLQDFQSDELVTCGVVAEGEFKKWESQYCGNRRDREDAEGQ